MKNKDLKKIYKGIFRSGYEKTYASVYTPSVVKGLEFTEEVKEVLHEGPWKGRRVIDVGCGTGLFAYAVALKGAKVLGIDYIPEAIKIARSRYRHKDLEYEVSSATKLSGKYDVIVSIGTLEHMDDPFGVLKRFKKHLKPGGKIVVTSPNWTNPRGYILQTLFQLFDMKITLADLHYLTPIEFERWARKLGMKLYWRTFDRDWAHGNKLIADFNRRLPLVFKSSGKHLSSQQVKSFTSWLEDHVVALDHNTPSSGAIGIYVFQAR